MNSTAQIHPATKPATINETGRQGSGFVTGYEVINQSGHRLAWFGVKNPLASFRVKSREIARIRADRFAKAQA